MVYLDGRSIKVTKYCAAPFVSTSLGSHTSLCTASSSFTFLVSGWDGILLRAILPIEQDKQAIDRDPLEMLRPATTFLDNTMVVPLEFMS